MRESIYLDFAGDIAPGEDCAFSGRFDDFLKKTENWQEVPFKEVKPLFDNSFTVANFESAVLEDDIFSDQDRRLKLRQDKSEYKGKFKNFHIAASLFGVRTVYKTNSGIDALNLANNHSFDFGETGFNTAVRELSQGGIICFGGEEVKIADYKNRKIALIGLSVISAADSPDAPHKTLVKSDDYEGHEKFVKAALEKAKDADIKILYYHWGKEYRGEPEKYQIDFAHRAAELGVDIIVGAHQHVIQKIEEYEAGNRKVPIAYGLGNLMFGARMRPRDKRSLIFRVKFSDCYDGYETIPLLNNRSHGIIKRGLKKIGIPIKDDFIFAPKIK